MATRKLPAENQAGMDESIFNWAKVGPGPGPEPSTEWLNPQTQQTILLPEGVKPTRRIIEAMQMNDADMNTPPATTEFEDSGFDDEEPAPQTSLERVMALLGGDVLDRADVKVYKMKEGNQESYCCQYTVEEFESGGMELIRTDYGPGRYRIRVYGSTHQSKKYGVRMNEVINIEDNKRGKVADLNQNQLIELLNRQQNPTPVSAQPTPLNQMKEMLQMMLLMRQVMGGDNPAPQKSSVAEIIEAIKELRGASELISPDKEDTGMLGVAKDIIGMVAANQQLQPQLPAPVQDFPQIRVPQTPVPEMPPYVATPESDQGPRAPIQQSESDPDDMNKFLIKQFISAIIKQAERNADVQPLAVDLYEKMPDEALTMMESIMWFDMLIDIHPGVARHEEWFTRLRAAIIAEIASDEAGE